MAQDGYDRNDGRDGGISKRIRGINLSFMAITYMTNPHPIELCSFLRERLDHSETKQNRLCYQDGVFEMAC